MSTLKVKDGAGAVQNLASKGSGIPTDPFAVKHVVDTVLSSEILTDSNGTRYVRALVLEPITGTAFFLRFDLSTGAPYVPVGVALEQGQTIGSQLILSFTLNQVQSFGAAPAGARRFLIWSPAGDTEDYAFTTDGSTPTQSDRKLHGSVDESGFLEIVGVSEFSALKFKLFSEGSVPGGVLRCQPQV